MLTRYLFAILVSVYGICHAQPRLESAETKAGGPQLPSAASLGRRELNPLFERYEGGSKESEAKLIRGLAAKFALLQTSVGAKTGGNKRGTHAKGFCLDGELEIYPQKKENAWLQIGPFKKPLAGKQRPKVRIRFADASGAPQSNLKRDVRAISFSFEVDGVRQDFSMNNDPVFTFGNLTDFNNSLSLVIFQAQLPPGLNSMDPKGPIAKLFATNPDLALSFGKARKLADAQKGKHVYAYHTENYYSGSSFSFGNDRAAKFNLVRCCGLPAVREKLSPSASPSILVERTTDAVNGIAVPDPKGDKRNVFCFELEVQILDAKNMKRPPNWPKGGPPPTAVDWVEDATLNWTEAGAKSYKLGKLTAVPNSLKTGVECESDSGFDVNSNCWDELKPLGNINRARYHVERQSQRLRAQLKPNFPAPTAFNTTIAIDQGWNDQDREIFWYLPQGSYIIPYDWFMALIDPATKQPLREGLEQFGFIHADYDSGVSVLNRDHLPIGMTRESPPGSAFKYLRGKGDWLGITCAACHVGAVTVKDTRYIIDGAPSTLDIEKFSLAIERSLVALQKADSAEFKKFQEGLRNPGVDENKLRKEVGEVLKRLADRNTRSFFHGKEREGNQTVNAGPGRADAFGVILNEVASRALNAPSNTKPPTAPVSFPHLWGSPLEEWVQYSGVSNNAFTRNVGQVLGVFGDVILDPKSDDFLATTARFRNLQVLEEKLRTLRAPRWEQVFGDFDAEQFERIKRGAAIFSITCASCHSENPEIVTMVPLAEFGQDLKRNNAFAGTDPLYFANLKRSWMSGADTGLLKGTSVLGELGRKDPAVAKTFNVPYSPLSQLFSVKYKDKGDVIKVLAHATMGISLKYMTDKGIPMHPKDLRYKYLTGGDLPAEQPRVGFKARSLDGIAFTGPYFHNGSVRTLREVLFPEERSTDFYIGGTGYDKENGGFENAGNFHFRANKLGNLNIGHDFAAHLSDAEKEDLLMYLKSL
jgi:hypothetical protein